MDEAPQSFPESGGAPPSGPWQWPAQSPVPPGARRRRWPKVAAAAGIVAGTAMGAAVLAAAATSGNGTPGASAGTDATNGSPGSSSSSGSGSATTPPAGPRGPGRRMGMGGPGFGMGGDVLHGVYTIQGPSGYETLQVQTGTVSSIAHTSGSSWSMTVTSADGTPLTYVIDSGTTVDGGETGVSSIAQGDTVHVTAVVSSGTATAKQVADSTVMQANGQSWRPSPPGSSTTPPSSSSGSTTS